MKGCNYIISLWLSITIVLLMTSCQKKENEVIPGSIPPALSVCVVKFVKPEYKNYVLASYFEGDTCFTSMRGNWCGEPMGESEYSPYWNLPDNWFLVDWKWAGFPYATYTALTEQSWEDYPWTPDHTCVTWSLTEPHTAEKPIEQCLYIHVANLEIYSNAYYGKPMIELILADVNNSSIDGKCVCELPQRMDSVWSVLQADLSKAIEKGDLENINNKTYDPGNDYYWW